MTYEMKLPTSKGDNNLYGHGGKCDSNVINNCNLAKTTAKFSNKQYGLFFLVNTFKTMDDENYEGAIYDDTRTLIHVVNAMKYTYPNNKATDVSI
jgi:hypothetical protein